METKTSTTSIQMEPNVTVEEFVKLIHCGVEGFGFVAFAITSSPQLHAFAEAFNIVYKQKNYRRTEAMFGGFVSIIVYGNELWMNKSHLEAVKKNVIASQLKLHSKINSK